MVLRIDLRAFRRMLAKNIERVDSLKGDRGLGYPAFYLTADNREMLAIELTKLELSDKITWEEEDDKCG